MPTPKGSAPNPAYIGARTDMLSLVPSGSHPRVLEVGCATGATAAALRKQQPDCHITGIELDSALAQIAEGRLDRVLVGDALAQLNRLCESSEEQYDLVLCGDVLEHLVDPWSALRYIRRLCPSGYVVVSLPNVAHISTVMSLVFRSYWPYRERGIHDRTHLRFFGRNNLKPLFSSGDFKEVRRLTHHRVIERPHKLNGWLEPIVSNLPILNRMTEYQFISLLR